MRLEVTDRDKRKIEADSFLDGGFILLWCLYFNKANLLQLFLSEKMIDFWRYAQLKTLLWASLSSKDKEQYTGTVCAQALLGSPVMQQVFAEMAIEQKNDFIYYTLEIGFEMQ